MFLLNHVSVETNVLGFLNGMMSGGRPIFQAGLAAQYEIFLLDQVRARSPLVCLLSDFRNTK